VLVSDEFRLVVDCCRAAFSGVGLSMSPVTPKGIDWARFLRLARFHRVQGLIWEALASSTNTPPDVLHEISSEAEAIAASNLQSILACNELFQEFDAASISFRFVKGLTLGALAYNRAAIKASADIDLLVPVQMLHESASILGSAGYELIEPKRSSALEAWHDARKESLWRHRATSTLVDLHTRLTDNPLLLPDVGITSKWQMVSVAKDIALPTLQDSELFAYLCIHGASSAWFRLKWVTDLAAWLNRRSSAEIQKLYQRSQVLGAGRAAGQALLLADKLYGTLEENAPLKDVLNRDATTRWLCSSALKLLAGRDEPVEPTSRLMGTFMIHLTQFGLHRGWRFKTTEFGRQWRAVAARLN